MPVRDAVCGMDADENSKFKKDYNNKTYYFCSKKCEQNFAENPEKFA